MKAIATAITAAMLLASPLAHACNTSSGNTMRIEVDNNYVYARGETDKQCPSGAGKAIFFDGNGKFIKMQVGNVVAGTYTMILGKPGTVQTSRYASGRVEIKCFTEQ